MSDEKTVPTSVNEEEVLNMGEDALDKMQYDEESDSLSINGENVGNDDTENSDKQAGNEQEPGSQDDSESESNDESTESDSEQESKTGDEDSSEQPLGGESENENESDADKTSKRLADTQKAFRTTNQKLIDTEKELLKTQQELNQSKLQFKELSKEEESDLRDDDPEEWIKYDDKRKQFDEAQEKITERVVGIQLNEIRRFGQKYFPDVDMTSDEGVAQFLQSEQFKGIDEFLNTINPGDMGIYSLEQIERAYKAVNHDTLVKQAIDRERDNVINNLEKTANNKNLLDGSGNERNSTSSQYNTNPESLTQEQIDEMGEDQVAAAVEEYNKRGSWKM